MGVNETFSGKGSCAQHDSAQSPCRVCLRGTPPQQNSPLLPGVCPPKQGSKASEQLKYEDVVRELLSLLRQYPGGLSQAILENDLRKALSSRLQAQGTGSGRRQRALGANGLAYSSSSSQDVVIRCRGKDQAFEEAPDEQQQQERELQDHQPLTTGSFQGTATLRQVFSSSSSSSSLPPWSAGSGYPGMVAGSAGPAAQQQIQPSQAVVVAQVAGMERLRLAGQDGQAKQQQPAQAQQQHGSAAVTATPVSSGAWMAALEDGTQGAEPLGLYLHSSQAPFAAPHGPEGSPWLQGKMLWGHEHASACKGSVTVYCTPTCSYACNLHGGRSQTRSSLLRWSCCTLQDGKSVCLACSWHRAAADLLAWAPGPSPPGSWFRRQGSKSCAAQAGTQWT